jgi:hypothetical protein
MKLRILAESAGAAGRLRTDYPVEGGILPIENGLEDSACSDLNVELEDMKLAACRKFRLSSTDDSLS